jgi:hypothetical protein
MMAMRGCMHACTSEMVPACPLHIIHDWIRAPRLTAPNANGAGS